MRNLIWLATLIGCSMDPVSACVNECGNHRSSCLHEPLGTAEKSETHKAACYSGYDKCLDACKVAR